MLSRSDIVSLARATHVASRAAAVSEITGATLDINAYTAASAKIAQADRLCRRLNDRKAKNSVGQEIIHPKPVRESRKADDPRTAAERLLSAWAKLHRPEPTEPTDVHVCICTRMYDTGRSGDSLVDLWIDSLNWPHDWYKNLYHGRVVEEVADQFHTRQRWYKDAQDNWQSEMVEELLAKSVKYRIEQRCPAHIHYSGAMLDEQLGKDVYTSLDPEKDIENREAEEASREIYDESGSRIRKTEYRGDDADVAGSSDALTRQRRPEMPANPNDGRDNSYQMTFLPFEETKGARIPTDPARRGPKDPFRMQYAINQKRIASKERQARRDLWAMIQKMDDDSRKLYVAYVQGQKAEGHSFTRILPRVRMSVRASLLHLKEVA